MSALKSGASEDALVRFLFDNLPVRGVLLQLGDEWRGLRSLHDYDAPVAALLGQAIGAVTAIASTMKFDGMLTLQLSGKNAGLNMLIAQCDHLGHFRGMAGDRTPEASGDSFASLLGDGHLSMTIDARDAKDSYRGIVALHPQSLAATLTDYYRESAQLDAHFVLLSDDHQVTVLMLQRMPDGGDMSEDDWRRLCLMSDTLTSAELATGASLDIVHKLFAEDDVVAWEPTAVSFACRCSTERAERALKTLGEADAMSLLRERGGEVEIVCEFCNEKRVFDAVDVGRLFSTSSVPSDSALH
ncbi:MAG: Hsp33 family molecular chaperone HslO [Pseudomonadota bacterium]